MPFFTHNYRTRQVALSGDNFHDVLQGSCSIPFLLTAVHDIAGAPRGAYWDGGITDYHLHLDYASKTPGGLVLYPHFQRAVVPGWLDKGQRWRHKVTHFPDSTVVLAPNPDWLRTLPNGKLPDRRDFEHYGQDLAARVKAWAAASASQQLADALDAWLRRPDMRRVLAL